MTRIAIDLVPIRVGQGGAGSGIWTYARELLLSMDKLDVADVEIIVLLNEGQVPFLLLKNISIVVFPEPRKNVVRRVFWVHVQLPLWCKKNKIDVLHKVATETPWFCSAARVTTIHDFYYEFLREKNSSEKLRFYERLENIYFTFVTQLCFKKSSRLIAVSNSTKREAIQRWPACKGRVVTIHHGADDIQPKKACPSFRSDVFNVLCVAKFMEHKGQHFLIRAFNQLLSAHEELKDKVVLNLRGFQNDRAFYSKILTLIESSAVKDHINIIPYNAAENSEMIYAEADLVVLLSEYEGFGLPVLEAQSHGLPVLCSDLEVLQEVGGEGAEYVKREDSDRIAEALFQFIQDGEHYARKSSFAFDNVKKFSWDDAASRTVNVYRSVLKMDGE